MIYFVYFIKSYCCLFRNEAEIWRWWGSAGPRKPAGWWRTRAGLALPLWPLPVWWELPLQVSPQLERKRGRTLGGEVCLRTLGEDRFQEKSSSELGHRFLLLLETLFFNPLRFTTKKTCKWWPLSELAIVGHHGEQKVGGWKQSLWDVGCVCAYFFFLSLCHLLSPY